MQRLFDVFFSLRTTLVLMLALATASGWATFVENDFGTSTAKTVVYNTHWFEALMALMVVNFAGNILRFRMWKPDRLMSLTFHLSFVLILVGALVTRYGGFEGMMGIREGEQTNVILSEYDYLQVAWHEGGELQQAFWRVQLGNMGSNDFEHSTSIDGEPISLRYLDHKRGRQIDGILVEVQYRGETRKVALNGGEGIPASPVELEYDDQHLHVAYGPREIELPFSVRLRDFQLDRYPGSNSPSSYASEVTVIDKERDKVFDYRIFMNHILVYRGYRFYQSSYDRDELGTYLSVSKDPGKTPTYVGYALLFLALVAHVFSPSSRFRRAWRALGTSRPAAFVLGALLLGALSSLHPHQAMAQDADATAPKSADQSNTTTTASGLRLSTSTQSPEDLARTISAEHANAFGRLLVLDSVTGRVKPLDAYNLELVHKLARKDGLLGLNHNQVILGMLTHSQVWQNIDLIRISHPRMYSLLGVPENRKLVPFSDFFKGREYLLRDFVEIAYRKDPGHRNTFDKEAIKVDERLNIAYMIYNARLFNLIPSSQNPSNWQSIPGAIENGTPAERQKVIELAKTYIDDAKAASQSGDWSQADQSLQAIADWQRQHGGELIPSDGKVSAEIFLTKHNIFKELMSVYGFAGLALLIAGSMRFFRREKVTDRLKAAKLGKVELIALAVIALGLLAHTIGLGLRWYVSGHAPMSNSYESMVYIAWATALAGVLFARKSVVAAAGASVLASIGLMVAHLGSMNPQITTLVPVLKSYWLTIHVAVITASYGFFGLSLFAGLMVLALFVLRSRQRPRVEVAISDLTHINEMAIILGLILFTIGNFLGGVWANESWGRYWGWDPKETWSLIIILGYSAVVHLRFTPGLSKNAWAYAVTSILAFGTVLMTYFGVNFYLSGMHSYASGDPVPIPTWVYISLGALVALAVAAWFRRDTVEPLRVRFDED